MGSNVTVVSVLDQHYAFDPVDKRRNPIWSAGK